MKKQSFKNLFCILAAVLMSAASIFAQNSNILPAGKYWLKMTATTVHLIAVNDQPEHTILITVVRNGNDISIKTEGSKSDIPGHFGLTEEGITGPFPEVSFAINGTNNWLILKGMAVTKGAQGTFVFVPGTDGVKPTTSIPEHLKTSTVGSFTLTPYSDDQKMQPVSNREQSQQSEKAYNSGEEWWTAFKKWMSGEDF